MGIKEKVKKNQLDPKQALGMVDKSSQTFGWLKRRLKIVDAPKETGKLKKR